MEDTDLELILLEQLEGEPTCESPRHPSGLFGHRDGGHYSYVEFHCGCAERGIVIRCNSWLKETWTREHWNCALCGQEVETRNWFTLIALAEKDDDGQ